MSNENLPYVDRSDFTPNFKKKDRDDQLDLGWASGFFKDGRPFRIECWAAYGCTFLTYYFPIKGLEELQPEDLKALLVSENLITFDDEKFRIYGGFGGGINIDADRWRDASGIEMWRVTVVVGDEDGVYARDNSHLKGYDKV